MALSKMVVGRNGDVVEIGFVEIMKLRIARFNVLPLLAASLVPANGRVA